MDRLTNSNNEIPTFENNAEYWLKVYCKLKDMEDAEEQGLHLRLPISKDTPVYSIEYCCGRNKNDRIGMCVRGFCKDCDDKAYYIREDTAEHCIKFLTNLKADYICSDLACSKCKYVSQCTSGEMSFKIAIDKAIAFINGGAAE